MVRFNVTFSEQPSSFKVGFGDILVVPADDLPVYEGQYEVIPSTTKNQTLPTAKKMMEYDVTVIKIPYAEVSNLTGGMTVTIGNEV